MLNRININSSPRSPRAAFSLIELIAVIAIISVMMVLAVPALGSLRNGGSMNKAVLNVSLLMEQARTYAMSHNTYVWMGFVENGDGISVATMAGVTGAAEDLANNTCRPVTKVQSFENVCIDNVSGLVGQETGTAVSSSNMQFEQQFAGAKTTFKNVIQFSPSGGVRVQNPDATRWIQVGLKPKRGGSIDEVNVAALQVACLTGQVQVLRR